MHSGWAMPQRLLGVIAAAAVHAMPGPSAHVLATIAKACAFSSPALSGAAPRAARWRGSLHEKVDGIALAPLRRGPSALHPEKAMAQVKAVPDGMHTITPSLVVEGAAEAIEFYKRAFGAEELNRAPDPSGKKIW